MDRVVRFLFKKRQSRALDSEWPDDLLPPLPAGAAVTPRLTAMPKAAAAEAAVSAPASDVAAPPDDNRRGDDPVEISALLTPDERHPMLEQLFGGDLDIGAPSDQRPKRRPRFQFEVDSLRTGAMDLEVRRRTGRVEALRTAFTPSRPKVKTESFSGRDSQLDQIVSAIEEDHAHVVVFGNRGLGKSSIANVTAELASEAGYHVVRYACGSETSFEGMFRNIISRIPRQILDAGGHTIPAENGADGLLPPSPFGATQVAEALSRIRYGHALIIVDEFDRVKQPDLRNHLAETIKNVSDCLANATFLILGVARDLEVLLGHHPSIQRNLVSIHLPYMTPGEIDRLILCGQDASDLLIDDFARNLIVRLSCGLPYMAELICLHAGRAMLRRGGVYVGRRDISAAMRRILDTMDPHVVDLYNYATGNGQNGPLRDVLFAAACAPFDTHGGLFARDVAHALLDKSDRRTSQLTAFSLLSRLAKPDHGALLERDPKVKTGVKYYFADPLMRSYVLMRQIADGGLLDD